MVIVCMAVQEEESSTSSGVVTVEGAVVNVEEMSHQWYSLFKTAAMKCGFEQQTYDP